MKELIRHILKEETEDSDLNTKGIDLAIKLLKKSYPYIIGWEINDERTFTIYLDIICDIEKLKEFYNSDLKSFYYRHKGEIYNDKLPFPTSALEIGFKLSDDEKYKEYSEMKQELNDIYQMLPDHLIQKDRYNDPKELDPDKFMYR
jgi:hypothetical protein